MDCHSQENGTVGPGFPKADPSDAESAFSLPPPPTLPALGPRLQQGHGDPGTPLTGALCIRVISVGWYILVSSCPLYPLYGDTGLLAVRRHRCCSRAGLAAPFPALKGGSPAGLSAPFPALKGGSPGSRERDGGGWASPGGEAVGVGAPPHWSPASLCLEARRA